MVKDIQVFISSLMNLQGIAAKKKCNKLHITKVNTR